MIQELWKVRTIQGKELYLALPGEFGFKLSDENLRRLRKMVADEYGDEHVELVSAVSLGSVLVQGKQS